MQVTRVERAPRVRYPQKSAVLENPAVLMSLPRRWRRNGVVCAALTAATAMLLTACDKPAGGAGHITVSPLFEHGDGRGGFGCVSIAPPAFLSESEAFEVISEIAIVEGLAFQQNSLTFQDAMVPKTKLFVMEPNDQPKDLQKKDLTLDGYDQSKNIGFEYVSTTDMEAWEVKGTVWSSVTTYEFKSAAQRLTEGLARQAGSAAIGVFYEPGLNFTKDNVNEILKDPDQNKQQEKLKALVKEDLRAQVRDFIAWLKAQGIA